MDADDDDDDDAGCCGSGSGGFVVFKRIKGTMVILEFLEPKTKTKGIERLYLLFAWKNDADCQ